MRARRGFGQRHLRRRHGFPASRVMLADEKLVIAKLVGILDQRDVTIEGQRRIFRRVMQRHHEYGEFHSLSTSTAEMGRGARSNVKAQIEKQAQCKQGLRRAVWSRGACAHAPAHRRVYNVIEPTMEMAFGASFLTPPSASNSISRRADMRRSNHPAPTYAPASCD